MLVPDPTRVRFAGPQDEDAILALCRRDHAERGIGQFAADKVRSVIRSSSTLIGIAGGDDIEGTIGLVVETAWNSSTELLVCRWNFVRPECRRSTHMRDMMAWAKELAKPSPDGIGVPLFADAIATPRTEGQVRLYRRQLGEPVSVSWLFEGTAQ